MTAKDFLNQAYLLDQRIKSKSEQIQSLNELATSCTATMTGMPHNPNRGTSRMADAARSSTCRTRSHRIWTDWFRSKRISWM